MTADRAVSADRVRTLAIERRNKDPKYIYTRPTSQDTPAASQTDLFVLWLRIL